jgi:hypothetical protein
VDDFLGPTGREMKVRSPASVDQIDEEQQRCTSRDDVSMNGFLLQLVACLGEGPGDEEEQDGDDYVEDVEHNTAISL